MNRDAVLESLAQLRLHLERHERLMQGELPAPGADDCRPSACHHRERFCRFLIETAAILDSTRRAFKSRQLELLRKECLRILAEEVGEPRARAAQEPRQGADAGRRQASV